MIISPQMTINFAAKSKDKKSTTGKTKPPASSNSKSGNVSLRAQEVAAQLAERRARTGSAESGLNRREAYQESLDLPDMDLDVYDSVRWYDQPCGGGRRVIRRG